MTTASVVFSLDELWFLRSRVRHELQGTDTWHFPPCSRELNDDIAEAILRCTEEGLTEAALMLSQGDLYLIDFVVDQDAKTPLGVPMGKPLLLKTFAARRDIADGFRASAAEPALTEADRDQKVADANLRYRRSRKRNWKE